MPNILVLGAQGMLGRVVYRYIKNEFSDNTWGTDRRNSNYFKFEAATPEYCIKVILKEIKKIDYVINCIGLLKKSTYSDEGQYNIVNTLLPKKLAILTESYNFKLIHVSTDAVFPPLSGNVFENDIPTPSGIYEISKYMGEINSKNILNFRMSVIGLDPNGHKGLLEWIKNNKNKSIDGYDNQIWTGCTTLQFAKLCKNIISKENFENLNSKSRIYHFTPLKSNKYDIIKMFQTLLKQPFMVNKIKGHLITRALYTLYPSYLDINSYCNILETALKEVITFDKKSYEE